MRLATARLVLKLWTTGIDSRLLFCMTFAHTTRALTITDTLLLKNHIEPKGRKKFPKLRKVFSVHMFVAAQQHKGRCVWGMGLRSRSCRNPLKMKNAHLEAPGNSQNNPGTR